MDERKVMAQAEVDHEKAALYGILLCIAVACSVSFLILRYCPHEDPPPMRPASPPARGTAEKYLDGKHKTKREKRLPGPEA